MTQDETQQVNAHLRFLEAQIANVAREGAQMAGMAEALAIKLKAAEASIKELEPKDNVVPIKDQPA